MQMTVLKSLLVAPTLLVAQLSQNPNPDQQIPPNLKYLSADTGTLIATEAQGIDTEELENTLRSHGILSGGDCDLGICECRVAPENAKRATAIALKLQLTGRFDIWVAPNFKSGPFSLPYKSVVSKGCSWTELIEKTPRPLQIALLKPGPYGTEEFRGRFPVAHSIVYCTRWYRNAHGVTVGYDVKLHGTSGGKDEWDETDNYQVADSGASIDFRGGNGSGPDH
jgi:hypothetical protein